MKVLPLPFKMTTWRQRAPPPKDSVDNLNAAEMGEAPAAEANEGTSQRCSEGASWAVSTFKISGWAQEGAHMAQERNASSSQ